MLNLLRRGKKNVPTLKKAQKMPELDDFLLNQDYEGAISVLNHKLRTIGSNPEQEESFQLWLGLCYYRLRKYEEAANVYNMMIEKGNLAPEIRLYLACCKYQLKQYLEAKKLVEKCPKSPLYTRLIVHVSLKLNDEKGILNHHNSFGTSTEDILSLAALNFSRMHYKAAQDEIQKVLQSSPNLTGLNIPLATCYAKQELTDVAFTLVQHYLRIYPDSPFAKNLKAAIVYRTVSSKANVDDGSELGKSINREYTLLASDMEALLKQKLYPDVQHLIRHNLVLYNDCDNALQVLPSLMKHVPEARLNLILFHLSKDNINDAMSLCKDLEPLLPHEFIVKGLVFVTWGTKNNSKDHLKMAENYFQIIGESESIKDTILGRQAQAAAMFLSGNFNEVSLYLESIELYFLKDDAFLMNNAQALFMQKNFKKAEEYFVRVSGPDRDRISFNLMLLKCYVRNKKFDKAWIIIDKPFNQQERKALLTCLANEAYIVPDYYNALLAFDELEKQDPSQENWFGKRGACAGLFRQLMNHKSEPKNVEQMKAVLTLIEKNSRHVNCEFMMTTIKQWGVSHKIVL